MKVLDAHFGRIIALEPLIIGNWNSVSTGFCFNKPSKDPLFMQVITSSVDHSQHTFVLITSSINHIQWYISVQVITSSIDRTVKVWNINNIFEQVHVIDRHELQIDSISLCQSAGLAITVTRGCVGVWDMLVGRLIARLADSPLGAIVTHAAITADSKWVVLHHHTVVNSTRSFIISSCSHVTWPKICFTFLTKHVTGPSHE